MNQHTRRAKDYARSKGFFDDADDFSQEFEIKKLGGAKASVEQYFVDFLRAKYGRAKAGERGIRNPGFTELKVLDYQFRRTNEFEASIQNRVIVLGMVDFLKGDYRILFVLKFIYGLETEELQHVFGLSRPSILKKVDAVIDILKQKWSA